VADGLQGHFCAGPGLCHPLTVLDDHCRYALGLRACADERETTVRGQLTALFRRYGLPQAVLCDNGPPWGAAGQIMANGARAFTRLEVWLMRHAIATRHGGPYHPQTQGKDERFHRTLNVEVLQMRQPIADLPTAQAAFDAWRAIYNHERPHEALGLNTPASRYRPSPVRFPKHRPNRNTRPLIWSDATGRSS
jgi:transposase InsO family protein